MNDLLNAVKGAKAHDDEAFQVLYEKTKRVALAVIKRYCDVSGDYEDILQETYLRVYQSIGQLTQEDKVQAWINRIAANTAIRHNMKKRPQLFSELADEEGNIPEFRRIRLNRGFTRAERSSLPGERISESWESSSISFPFPYL